MASESRFFLRAILDHLAHPVFVKDREFRFVLFNPALSALVGRTGSELLGKTDYDFFPAEQADHFRDIDTRVFRDGETVVIEEESLTDQGGELHALRTVKAPLRDASTGEVTHLVGIITDVTRLKRAEGALRRANDDLAQANDDLARANDELERRVAERTAALESAQEALLRKERLTVLGQLAGGLAHQIRNPLAAIATASSILKRKLAGAPDPEVLQAHAAHPEEGWGANRLLTGDAPGSIGLERCWLDPRGLQLARPVPCGAVHRPGYRFGRAPALDLGGEPAGLGVRSADDIYQPSDCPGWCPTKFHFWHPQRGRSRCDTKVVVQRQPDPTSQDKAMQHCNRWL